MSLGNNIKKYRHDLGITQEELAGILCVTGQAAIIVPIMTDQADYIIVIQVMQALAQRVAGTSEL